MLRRCLIAVAVSLVCLQVLVAPASAAPGERTLASTSAQGVKGNADSGKASISSDGSMVAFESVATNLVDGDTDSISDIYLKDLRTGDVVLVSATADGTKSDMASYSPSLSADGTMVAFYSRAANLHPADLDGNEDVYVKNLVTGALTLASTSDDGTKGNEASLEPQLSADGTTVVFRSRATNLDPQDTDVANDIYAKDLTTGDLQLVSTSADGPKGNGSSQLPSVSGDGDRVAFSSWADNLHPADADMKPDVFVKDLDTGVVRLASVSADGTKGDRESYGPVLSADGTAVAFYTFSQNFAPGDTDIETDVYVKDLESGDLVLASITADGVKANVGSYEPSLSAGGTTVAFSTGASNLDPRDPYEGSSSVYVKDLVDGRLDLAESLGGVAGNGQSRGPSLNGAGTHLALHSSSNNLDPGDSDFVADVYVKELPDPADEPPTVVLGETPAALTNDSTPTFTFDSDGATGFECSLSQAADAFVGCASPFTPSTLADGAYTFKVRGTNGAGNTGEAVAFEFTVDTQAPAAAIDTGPGAQTADTTPTFEFSAEPGATFQCFFSPSLQPFRACSSPITYGPLAEGGYTFSVRAVDAAGNVGTATSYPFTVGSVVPPAAPSRPDLLPASDTGLSDSDDLTTDTTPTFVGTAEPGTTVEVAVDGVARGSAATTAGGTYEVTVGSLPLGEHSVTARATTGTSSSETSDALTIRVVAPTGCVTATNVLTGTNVGNVITGGRLGDRILGLGGNDTLDGKANNDCVVGGPGNDVVRGGAGSDELGGDDGADTLALGAGVDLALAGPGNDRITSRDTVADRVDCGSGTDVVTADSLDVVVNCETVRRG